MFRLTIKEIAAKKLRLLSTAMAVFLGVAFLAGTLVLTDTVTKTFNTILADANAGTDAYVRGDSPLDLEFNEQRPRIEAAQVDQVRNADGVAEVAVRLNGYAQLVDKDGDPIGDPDAAPTFGLNWVEVDELNPYDVVEGRAPAAADEIVIDKNSADGAGFEVGDRTTVLTRGEPRAFTIAGIAKFGDADSGGGATSVMFTEATAQEMLSEPGMVDGIAVTAQDGVSQEALVASLSSVVEDDVEVITGAQLTEEDQESVQEGIASFSTFMLVFAFVAVFVGAFIINNTFSITVTQRTKEMAMLRAIGAGRRQLMRAVLAEAAVVGVLASAAGLAAGIGVAAALKAMLASFGLDIPGGPTVLETNTIVVSMAVGVIVTLVSALTPALKASRVAPIAALRDVAVDRSGASKRRTVTGVMTTAAGVAAVLGGLSSPNPALVGIGAIVVYLGVSVLGPVLARPFAYLTGTPLAKVRGMSGVLARQNAMRNPGRTSKTAASLMIGVGLVGFITIFAASAKESLAGSLDEDYNGTHIVESGAWDSTTGISPELAATLRNTPGITTVTEERITRAEVDGHEVGSLYAYDPTTVGTLFDLGAVEGDVGSLGSDGIAVEADQATSKGWELGDTVEITFPSGSQPFEVRAIYSNSDEWVGTQFVGVEAFAGNVPTQLDARVYVAGDEAAIATAAAAYPTADVLDKQGFVDRHNEDIDQMLGIIYAMLALAVIIALVGIANTLALSIYERRRELGLLRAVGMSRAQVRSSVRWEAAIIAVFGTGLGLGIGAFFGWAMVQALAEEGLNVFVIPTGSLVVVTVIAAVAGIGAAIMPARRAARLDVLKAVASS